MISSYPLIILFTPPCTHSIRKYTYDCTHITLILRLLMCSPLLVCCCYLLGHSELWTTILWYVLIGAIFCELSRRQNLFVPSSTVLLHAHLTQTVIVKWSVQLPLLCPSIQLVSYHLISSSKPPKSYWNNFPIKKPPIKATCDIQINSPQCELRSKVNTRI